MPASSTSCTSQPSEFRAVLPTSLVPASRSGSGLQEPSDLGHPTIRPTHSTHRPEINHHLKHDFGNSRTRSKARANHHFQRCMMKVLRESSIKYICLVYTLLLLLSSFLRATRINEKRYEWMNETQRD